MTVDVVETHKGAFYGRVQLGYHHSDFAFTRNP